MMTVPRLSLKHKILYGAGSGGWSLIDRLLFTWIYTFYISGSLERGEPLMQPLLFSVIMFMGRSVDAVADPLIARYSDNHGGKRGRRIPFMTVSGIFYVIVFIALFYPVNPGQSTWNSVYLALMLGLYFVLFTAYVCPYLALLPELARNTRDRVDLATCKAIFGLAGGGLAMIGSGILIGFAGFHGMIWIMAAAGLILIYLPVLIPEKKYSHGKPATMDLFKAILTTFKNRPFVIYLAGSITFWFGFNIISLNLPLYVMELMGKPEEATSFYFSAMAACVVFFPLINYLVKRWGLKKMMILSMLVFAVTLPFLFFTGVPLLGLSPDLLWFLIIGICCFSITGLMIIPDAIVAVISDLDEKNTGQRREAMYFGAQGFVMKLNLGLSTLLSGALLQFFGSPLGIRLTGPVSALLIFAGMLIFTRFPEKQITAVVKQDSTALNR